MTDRFPDHEPDRRPATFRADLPRVRQRRRRLGPLARGLAAGAVGLVLALVLAGAWVKLAWLNDLPPVPRTEALWSLNRAPGITFLDRNGQKLAVRGPRHGQRVRLAELPPYAPKAFLAAEDRRFYEHGAIDWLGVGRAAVANWRAGDVVEGGSTLTQQLAKTLFLKPDQTFRRKAQEAWLARRLSKMMSRDEILELYLNRIFFGASAYGLDAAAQTYFGKPARSLSLSEAALLAALPKAPSRLSPVNDMPAALARSHLVLDRMVQEGWITAAAARAAIAAPPRLVPEAPEDDDYGYVLDMAQAEAARLAKGRAPDLVVRLSLDPALQTTASVTLRQVMRARGTGAGARQAALVMLAPDGGVRALVGGMDHRFSPFNRAVQAQRQPGSAFKPFVYAAALETGIKPTDIRKDAPVRLGPWAPENYGGGYRGAVTVEEALVRSINTVAVRLTREIGVDRVADISARFGLVSIPLHPRLPVALGAYETNLLELTSGYQVFQQGGRRITPWLVAEITTSSGQPIYQRAAPAPQRVYDPARSAVMVRMMKGVIDRGTGSRAAFGRPAAGKTGTSQGWRDAWFVGFTPDWVCGVWTGNDDNRPMNRVSGGDLPAEIWRRVMLAAHEGMPVRDFAWIEPDPSTGAAGPTTAAGEETRSSFYRTLSSEFARAASESGSDAPAETQ